MHVLRNIGQLATCRAPGGQGEIHAIPNAALVWNGPIIHWVGPESELPAQFHGLTYFDARQRLVIPGLIDCHTHLAFGGWRAEEFEQRILGKSYLDIARAGGGIASTVTQTRRLTREELRRRSREFLGEIVKLGVTTVECKSGYGLEEDTEFRLLRVYRELADDGTVDIVPTFLGAHVVPAEYKERREAYISLLTATMIPAIARDGLADFCDVFVEQSAFTIDETRHIMRTARAAGLGLKLHADQLTSGGGAELAAELGAASADHLECISQPGIAAMAEAGVVAVTLPLASLYLNHAPAPARAMIEAGVAVAVATDFNPGSAPSYHLPLAMMLACTTQRMTPAEVLKGATLFAARAIGREPVTGSLEPGKRADFALIDAPDVTHWLYHFRPNACVQTVSRGIVRWTAPPT
jgi:imidazolonepropionase